MAHIAGFVGLDLRRRVDSSPPNTLRVADNVDLTGGGGLKSRAQLRPFATVDATSKGMYVANGFLRTAIPVPASGVFPNPPPGFQYDYFSNQPLGGYSGTVTRLTGAQVWDRKPYICIERRVSDSDLTLGFQYEHHYIPDPSAFSIAAIGNTKVNTPFTPGPHIFALSGKIIGHDLTNANLWFSSTINGPTDWTNSGDAGYLPVTRFINIDPDIKGFAVYGNRLAVFFLNAVQLWSFYTDPADNTLADTIGGAGTEWSRSIANKMGDLIYFAQGGFRNLSVTAVTGQSTDSDVGAPILPQTSLLDLSSNQLVALWSPSRSQYMCAIGNVIYVYTDSPVADINGWTRYIAPSGSVITDMVDHKGKVYVRSGANISVFDDAYTQEVGFSWTVRPPFLYAGSPGLRKQWCAYEAAQTGTHTALFYTNARDESITHPGPTVAGSTYGINHIPLAIVSDSISPQLTGAGIWQLDTLSFRVKEGNA